METETKITIYGLVCFTIGCAVIAGGQILSLMTGYTALLFSCILGFVGGFTISITSGLIEGWFNKQ